MDRPLGIERTMGYGRDCCRHLLALLALWAATADANPPPLPAGALPTHVLNRDDGEAPGVLGYPIIGEQGGLRYSYGSRTSAIGSAAADQHFGLGGEFGNRLGHFSVGGAVSLSELRPDPNALPHLAFGPQLGYRSDRRSALAAEVLGSYFYSRRQWIGRTFVGYRTTDGWAVGPEAWRLGEGRGLARGGGLAVHDLDIIDMNVGLRFGIETRSAIGRRVIAGIDISWGKP